MRFFSSARKVRESGVELGPGQYHLAVAGGCASHLVTDLITEASKGWRTHPLPRGGTDPAQAGASMLL